MLAIGEPDIDWVSLAESMGVEATAVTTAEDFDEAFEKAMKSSGPKLIAAIVPG